MIYTIITNFLLIICYFSSSEICCVIIEIRVTWQAAILSPYTVTLWKKDVKCESRGEKVYRVNLTIPWCFLIYNYTEGVNMTKGNFYVEDVIDSGFLNWSASSNLPIF